MYLEDNTGTACSYYTVHTYGLVHVATALCSHSSTRSRSSRYWYCPLDDVRPAGGSLRTQHRPPADTGLSDDRQHSANDSDRGGPVSASAWRDGRSRVLCSTPRAGVSYALS